MQEKIYVRAVLFFIITLILAVIITWYPILFEEKEIIPVSTESLCEKGTMQSPIDIQNSNIQRNDKVHLQLNYNPSLFQINQSLRATSLSKNNSAHLKDETYQLMNFHFHTPSEHTINGKAYKMELHLVHENREGDKLVVAALFKEGDENELLTKLFQAEQITTIDLSSVTKVKTAYFYNGSLTTSPCTEGVKWIVLAEPQELSKEQLETYTKLYPPNNRPIQQTNGRSIEEIQISEGI